MRFTEVKAALDEIAERTAQNVTRRDNAYALYTKVNDDLAAMLTEYAGIVQAVNDGAAANPSDTAWQNALAEKNELVADFQALRTDAQAIIAAIDAVTTNY